MEAFAISPASSKPMWILVAICAVLAVVLVALAYTAWSARHSRLELDHGRLRLVGDFWARSVPLDHIDVSRARVLDLDAEPQLSPRRRTLGTALPGYASGWFRLRSGEKALVYVTDRRRVLYMPTSAGYALLLSVEQPERVIEAVQRHTSGT